MEDGIPKQLIAKPLERPKQTAKLLRGSTYMAWELFATSSHLNTILTAQQNVHPSTQTEEQYTSHSTTQTLIDQTMSQSLIYKNRSYKKTFKTRYTTGAYVRPATTIIQRIYITMFNTSTGHHNRTLKTQLLQKMSPFSVATLLTILAANTTPRQAHPTTSTSVRLTNQDANN